MITHTLESVLSALEVAPEIYAWVQTDNYRTEHTSIKIDKQNAIDWCKRVAGDKHHCGRVPCFISKEEVWLGATPIANNQ